MLWRCIEDAWELTGALQARVIKKGSFVHSSSVHLQPVEGNGINGRFYELYLHIDQFGTIPIDEFKQCFVLADESEIVSS